MGGRVLDSPREEGYTTIATFEDALHKSYKRPPYTGFTEDFKKTSPRTSPTPCGLFIIDLVII